MKFAKRLLAGVCALTLCCGLAACGGSGSSDDESSKAKSIDLNDDQQKQVEDLTAKLPERDLANKEIKWLAHYDINPGDGQAISPGLKLFQEKYGGSVKFIQTTWENRYTDLAKSVMANDSPDFFPASDMDGFPRGAIKAMFDPLDDVIDFGSELWANSQAVNDSFIFNGKHYAACIQAAPNFVCIYNTKTIEDNGYEDPAELYYNDEWTWSKFSEMCLDFTDADADKYALDGYWYGQALNDTCGVPLIGLSDGKLVNNMSDPQVSKVQELMYELQKNEVVFDRSSNNWSTRGDGTTGEGLGSYLTLFIPCGLWGIENSPENVKPFGDVAAGEIMFCPMPRMDDSDKYYVSARVDGYHLCKNAPNPEGFAAYMDCLQVANAEASNITVEQLKNEYKWNDDMLAMREEVYRLVNENPVFDFQHGVSPEMETQMQSVNQATMITGGGATTWTATVAEYEKAVDYLIKEANENISETPEA
ncbi:MAG: carbohydrate ABC transporter substrate-binding protein [Ruminococcus sp.]|nr:carbohydrate ABC transporter substrate-binding protein [Ruminococcus sp.]